MVGIRFGSCFGGFSDGHSLLDLISQEGSQEEISKVLSENPRLAFWSSMKEKRTALHRAAEQGRLELAEALIQAAREATQEKGDKKVQEAVQKVVDYADFSGMTPLMYACQQGHADVAQYLLDIGADALATDARRGYSCLHYAAKNGRAECISVLSKAVIYICGQPRPLRGVLVPRDGFRYRFVDARCARGFSPLHLATLHSHTNAVKALLSFGADIVLRSVGMRREFPNDRCIWTGSSTALHIAAAVGHYHIGRILLIIQAVRRNHSAAHPDPRGLRDVCDRTPMEVAQKNGYDDLAVLMDSVVPLSSFLPAPRVSKVNPEEAIAAAAVRGRLTKHLDSLPEPEPIRESADGAVASGAGAGAGAAAATDCVQARNGDGLEDRSVGRSKECPVCLEAVPRICLSGCHHRYCSDCMHKLCNIDDKTLPICPMCRSFITDFSVVDPI